MVHMYISDIYVHAASASDRSAGNALSIGLHVCVRVCMCVCTCIFFTAFQKNENVFLFQAVLLFLWDFTDPGVFGSGLK